MCGNNLTASVPHAVLVKDVRSSGSVADLPSRATGGGDCVSSEYDVAVGTDLFCDSEEDSADHSQWPAGPPAYTCPAPVGAG